jgi:hypothetical protein
LRFDERVYVRPAGRTAVEAPITVKRPASSQPKHGRAVQTG